jgi:hypothetical protein
MGLFSSRTPKPPQIRIIKQSSGSRVLDFSEFMNDSMKRRIRSGTLDFMDKVAIFEDFYIPTRQSEGWLIIKGGRSNDDRFKVTWQVADQVLIGTYNDLEFTVTERVKKTK